MGRKKSRGTPAAGCGSSVSFVATLLAVAFTIVMPLWSGIMVFVHYDWRIYEPQVVSGAANAVALGMGMFLNSLLTELTPITFPAAVFLVWGSVYSFVEVFHLVTPSSTALLNGTTEFRTVVLNPVFVGFVDESLRQKSLALLTNHIAASLTYGVVGLTVGLLSLGTFLAFAPSMILDKSGASFLGFAVRYQRISTKSVWITSWDMQDSSVELSDGETVLELEDWPVRLRLRSLARDWSSMWHPTAVYAKVRTMMAWMFVGAMSTELTLNYLVGLKPAGMWIAGAHHAFAPMCFVVGVFATPLTPFAKGSQRAYGRLGRHVVLVLLSIWSYIVCVFAYANTEIDIDSAAFLPGQNVLRAPTQRCWGNSDCFFQLCLGNIQMVPTTVMYERSTNTSFLVKNTNCREFADRTIQLWNAHLTMVVVGGVFLASQLCHTYYLWRDTYRPTDILKEITERRLRTKSWWRANNTWPPGLFSTKQKPT